MSLKHETFVNRVDENLFCPICHEVLQDPVSCKDGHAFCNECITEWLKTNNTCPLDNTLLRVENLVRLLLVRGVIDNLEVYCQPKKTEDADKTANCVDNSSKTCYWIGMLKNIKVHRETCRYQEVKCPNENCIELMQRRELEDHDKVCDFKVVGCEECDLNLVRQDLEEHKENDCPEKLIPCPNNCTIAPAYVKLPCILRRMDLEEHLTNTCAKTIVSCPLEEHGCLAQVERQHVDKHIEDNTAAHMMLLGKKCSVLAKENQLLKDELHDTKLKLKEESVNQLLGNSSYTWVVPDYPNLCKNHPNGSCIKSPPFWVRGYKWRINLYPNGNKKDAKDSLSLYLKKVEENSQALNEAMPNACSNDSKIPFRVTVISQMPDTDDVSRESKHVFTKKEDSRGWAKFMKSSHGLSPSYCNNDSLTIQCTILQDKPQ